LPAVQNEPHLTKFSGAVLEFTGLVGCLVCFFYYKVATPVNAFAFFGVL